MFNDLRYMRNKKHQIFSLSIFCIVCFTSCNEIDKKEFVALESIVIRDFRTFWSYWNNQVFLDESFNAEDAGTSNATLNKAETLSKLNTGRYLPMRYKTDDSIYHYKLIGLPKNIEKSIPATIQQMASIELAHMALEEKPLPQNNFTDINGFKFDENYTNNQFLVIKCWFIKCMPCEQQRPAYEALMGKYSDKNLLFFTLADDKKEDLIEYNKTRKVSFGIVADQVDYIRNNLGINIYPTYIIVGPNGHVIKVVNGIDRVEKLLAKLELNMRKVHAPPPPKR